MKHPFKVFLLFFSFSLLACPGEAYRILFYCNSSDGISGVVKRCVPILEKAGHRVTVIDMKGKNHDPSRDNWGPPYDQVWDMRFVDRKSTVCGSGRPQAADYFDEHWKDKAVSFLNHCGKLFIAGEYFTFVDRDEGLYPFLKEIGAVKRNFDACPPSSGGNSSTQGGAFYPVHHGLGPLYFYGDMVGGIPLNKLNGTSFVETDEDWVDDEVKRSVVCGWKGEQLGGRIAAPFFNRGKLFMVWDATMWSDGWNKQPNPADEGAPIWDDSAWTPGQMNVNKEEGIDSLKARKVTEQFFPAVARWLGGGACPCGSPVPEPWTPTPTMTPVLLLAKAGPTPLPTPIAPPLAMPPLLSMTAAQTMVFNTPPINIYMKFKDGVGNYRLDIYDSRGVHLNNPYSQAITLEKEAWASWDGTNGQGILESFGQYYAYLSKDGKFLRKIVLTWIQP